MRSSRFTTQDRYDAVLWRAVLATLVLACHPSCTLVADTSLGDRVISDVTDDVASDTTDADASDEPELDTSDDVEVDTTTDTGPIVPECGDNGCCGTATLLLGGDAVSPGDRCGECASGIVACTGPDSVACVREGGRNRCGGCGQLPGEPGESCGRCGDGEWQCDGLFVSCVGATPLNACGGCEPLPESVGDECVRAGGGAGQIACAGPNETTCAEPGKNACGGTARLPELGRACGECGLSVFECDPANPNATRCAVSADIGVNVCGGCTPLPCDSECISLDPSAEARRCGRCSEGLWTCDNAASIYRQFCRADGDDLPNACGGCAPLEGDPLTPCGPGEAYYCTADGTVRCEPARSETNPCGGEGELEGPMPGERCGPCDDGTAVCVSPDATQCTGGTSLNVCGTCALLPGLPGETCAPGRIWTCDADKAIECAEAREKNPCGGSATIELDGDPGQPCGVCGSGRWVCSGSAFVTCRGDRGDAAKNRCGGCGPLDAEPGAPCGPCNLDTLVCDGTDAVTCDGATPCEDE